MEETREARKSYIFATQDEKRRKKIEEQRWRKSENFFKNLMEPEEFVEIARQFDQEISKMADEEEWEDFEKKVGAFQGEKQQDIEERRRRREADEQERGLEEEKKMEEEEKSDVEYEFPKSGLMERFKKRSVEILKKKGINRPDFPFQDFLPAIEGLIPNTPDNSTLVQFRKWIFGTNLDMVNSLLVWRFFSYIYTPIGRTTRRAEGWRRKIELGIMENDILSRGTLWKTLTGDQYNLWSWLDDQILSGSISIFIDEIVERITLEIDSGRRTKEKLKEDVLTILNDGRTLIPPEDIMKPNYVNFNFKQITALWEYFFQLLIIMTNIMNLSTPLSEIISLENNYREVNKQYFPFIFDDVMIRENSDSASYMDLIARILWRRLDEAGVFTGRRKEIGEVTFTLHLRGEDPANGLNNIYFQLKIDLALEYWRSYRNEMRQTTIHQLRSRILKENRNSLKKIFQATQDLLEEIAEIDDFVEWFIETYESILYIEYARYREEGKPSMDSLKIYKVSFFISLADNFSKGKKFKRLPVHCRSDFKGLAAKFLYLAETTDAAICMFEAWWTAKYIKSLANGRRGPFRTKALRFAKINEDFIQLSVEQKAAIWDGDLDQFQSLINKGEFPIIEWDSDIFSYIPPTDTPILLHWGNHMICCDPMKLAADLQPINRNLNYNTFPSEKTDKPGIIIKKPSKIQDWKAEVHYFLDIEAYTEEDGSFTPYLLVLLNSSLNEEHVWWGEGECIAGFMRWLNGKLDHNHNMSVERETQQKISIWTYNGMKFDNIFFIQNLIGKPGFNVFGTLNSMKGLSVANITFRDLLKICPFGTLRKQSEFWKTNQKKGDIEFSDIDKISKENKKDEIIRYCVLDCLVLEECVFKYMEWVSANLQISPLVLSTAALSLSYFKFHHLNPRKFKITGLPKEYYQIVRDSYKGGICMVVKKKKEENKEIFGYDINSSYPFIMYSHEIPYQVVDLIHFPVAIEEDTANWQTVIQNSNLYGVTIFEWEEDMKIPTFPVRDSDGLNHVRKINKTEWIWGIELRFAISTGKVRRFKIESEMIFRKEKIFSSFVTELYHKRRQECKRIGDSIGDKFYKLLLNSLYGKFGQKLYPERKYFKLHNLSEILPTLSENPTHVVDDIFTGIPLQEPFYNQIGTCIHIASYITAAARVNLMKGVQMVSKNFTEDSVYYMDTDSIYTSNKLPDSWLSETELGKWGLEKKNIEEFLAPGKKLYYIRTSNGNITAKSKGLANGSLSAEDYKTLLETGVLENKDGGKKWERTKDLKIKIKPNIKTLKIKDKRLFDIVLNTSKPFDSV